MTRHKECLGGQNIHGTGAEAKSAGSGNAAEPATMSGAKALVAAALRLGGYTARGAAIMAAREADRWRAKLSAQARRAA